MESCGYKLGGTCPSLLPWLLAIERTFPFRDEMAHKGIFGNSVLKIVFVRNVSSVLISGGDTL